MMDLYYQKGKTGFNNRLILNITRGLYYFSRAIMVYLLEKYAKDDSLYPKDLKARAVINARLNFDNGTFWPRLLTAAVSIFLKKMHERFSKFIFPQYPVFMGGKTSEEANKSLTDAVSAIEEFLTRDKWVAGSKMTVADISISTTMLTLLVSYCNDILPLFLFYK